MNEIHPSGMVIFVVVLLTAILFKKGFCSWICPVGFVSELLGDISDKIFRRRIKPPRWLDYPLRGLKYFLLGFFLWAILISMTPESIKAFIYTDYNIVSDILMLRRRLARDACRSGTARRAWSCRASSRSSSRRRPAAADSAADCRTPARPSTASAQAGSLGGS